MGGYFWIYYWLRTVQYVFNTDYNGHWVFKFLNEVAMWGYLSHYLWIVLLNHFIVKPYNLSFLVGGPLVTFGTFILIPVSYVVLKRALKLLCPFIKV